MKTTIVTYADLGEFSNYKTPGIIPIICKLDENNELEKVICRRSKNFHFKNTFPVFSFISFFLFKGIVKSIKNLFTINEYRWERKIIDNFSASKINESSVIILHPLVFMKTARQAKKRGIITIGIAANCHPNYVKRIIKEESELFGLSLPLNKNRSFCKSISNLDYIVAYSTFTRKTFIEEGFPKDNIFVAYSDIDIQKYNNIQKINDNIFRILYVSHTSLRKGLHYLIESYKKIDIPNSELIIVGNIKLPKKLEIKVKKEIESNPSIKWVGFSRHPEKYYRKASVFVLPSLQEGNPKVVMEAMAVGIPVIATENARSIIENGKTGFVVPVRDSNKIKEKIEFLYNNKDIAKKMGDEARHAMENKKSFGDEFFEIYLKILKRENIKV